MTFKETPLQGSFLIDVKKFSDERGFFADSFDEKEFSKQKLATHFVQSSISFNQRKGILRGMHYQLPPQAQAKLVRCTRGIVYDVIIDLRPQSPTYCKWFSVELNEDHHQSLFIPEGFAHGFQTLTEKSEIFYQVTDVYAPQLARGARWDDPAFNIRWPITPPFVIERDNQWPDFKP